MFRTIFIQAATLMFLGITVCLNALAPSGANAGADCTYTTYTWNTQLGQAVDHRTVEKTRFELTADEIHEETGCTVCKEDMMPISVPGVEPVFVCAWLAPRFQSALDQAYWAGEPIISLVGQRVGRTKGPADENGDRTQYSYHSYGIALDVNPERNGLYTECNTFGPDCRLLQGGEWRTGQPESITADSVLVREMKAEGFLWGGEITGRQKDFMHFSPSGY